MTDVLFIVKQRKSPYSQEYAGEDSEAGSWLAQGNSSGLTNSVTFITDALATAGVSVAIAQAIDNNCIDRLVTEHKPKTVIIEALWVVPEKFDQLIPLHPTVNWVVRLHSESPFLAGEGIASRWLLGYQKRFPQVRVAANSPRMFRDLISMGFTEDMIHYAPNYYPIEANLGYRKIDKKSEVIDIACFGAIRPLKNTYSQALAAIEFSRRKGKALNFHINGNRTEGGHMADSMLRNIRDLFTNYNALHTDHKIYLLEWAWQDHASFIQAIRKNIDIGIQVSFSETFNIVSADCLFAGVPFVGSTEIPFSYFNADPTDVSSMVEQLDVVYSLPRFCWWADKYRLQRYNVSTVKAWLKWLQ